MGKRHKELIVFVTTLAVLGLLVVMTLGKGKGKPKTAQRPHSQPAVQVASRPDHPDTGGLTSDTADDSGPDLPLAGDIAGRPGVRDPFVPTINVSGTQSAAQPPSQPPSGTSVSPVPTGPPPHVPPLNIGSLLGPPITTAQPGVNTQPTAPPPDPITLSGIIEGDPPVAIFRRGDNRFFVKPGDQFAGNYRVIEISSQSVTVAHGSKRQSLLIGGKL
jgi:hypothetical protein